MTRLIRMAIRTGLLPMIRPLVMSPWGYRRQRYTPVGASGTCTPENADRSFFPLKLGEELPAVKDCNRKIYAVLIVFGYPVEE